jgi:hypothetical protein
MFAKEKAKNNKVTKLMAKSFLPVLHFGKVLENQGETIDENAYKFR